MLFMVIRVGLGLCLEARLLQKKLAKLGLGYAYHYGLCISLVYFSGGPLLLVDYRLVKRWWGRGLSLINPSHP